VVEEDNHDASSESALDAGKGSDAGDAGDAAVAGDAGELADAGDSGTITDAGYSDAGRDAGTDAGLPPPCTTRVTYGSAWLRPAGHTANDDLATGLVTWDGVCAADGAGNSFATLSNGWKPYFSGRGTCVLAFDASGACTPAPGACATRVTYGPNWQAAPNHTNFFDDVGGVVTWDGVCRNSGTQSYAVLSNGWTPYFSGTNGCDLSLRHVQCNSLYANPVVPNDCPDPGVLREGSEYYMACTSGGPGYPIRSSKDLVHWTYRGPVFTSATKPTWASGDFWAPELHKVGATFVVYFSARGNNGVFAIGAASATNVLGPYTDIGAPLVSAPSPGLIDAHHFESSTGARYILWKVDGNAVGAPTPIRIQPLAPNGLSVTGTPTTLITNTLPWEGTLVEGPWMVEHGGFFYLFYSANFYASAAYAIGVARATAPTGPFTKAAAPILVSKGAWAGPGHGSVLQGPSGDWVHVYHSWVAGKTGMAPGRQVLVDRITWVNGWPRMDGGPASRSQPLP
jgi:arabinan endo-1,5-alpha-L-arabinosidase